MTPKELKFQLFLNRIPITGIISFALLFLYAATLYPGGSTEDLSSTGFDWIHNYWCNLTNKKGMNGFVNPARPFAILAMVILCGSLTIFFYQFGRFFTQSFCWEKMIKWGGGVSIIFGALVFTEYHDLMTFLSSFFGIFAVLGIIVTIYRSELRFYKITGTFCIVLLAINNLIYYSTFFIEWLPLIQKISFIVVLGWVLGLNGALRRRIGDS